MIHQNAIRCAACVRRIYGKVAVKDKDISIISNNCIGADICHNLGLRFNSPTVNMQILPEDFIRFISDLPRYLQEDVTEYKILSTEDKHKVERMFRRGGDFDFPFGKCGDILLCFQHYKTFQEALAAWNRRRERVNLRKLGIILIQDQRYEEEIRKFDEVRTMYGNKLIFAINYRPNVENTKVIPVKLPAGVHFMENETIFRKYYEQKFNPIQWINKI